MLPFPMFRSQSPLHPPASLLSSSALSVNSALRKTRSLTDTHTQPTALRLSGFLSLNFQLSTVDLPSFPKSPHQYHSITLSHPLFSYSYALFCAVQNANTRIFSGFRTLCAKHRGWGTPISPLGARSSPFVAPPPRITPHYPLLPPPCTLYPASVPGFIQPPRSKAPCLKKKSQHPLRSPALLRQQETLASTPKSTPCSTAATPIPSLSSARIPPATAGSFASSAPAPPTPASSSKARPNPSSRAASA